MQVITKQLRRLKRDKRGISTVITVMLSLVLLVVIVGNVFISSYQMNQVDTEKMQENLNITHITQAGASTWFTAQQEFTVNVGTYTGTYSGTQAAGDFDFETFTESTGQTLFAHRETVTIGAANYYRLLDSAADNSGQTVDVSMSSTGRNLIAKSVYSLQGVLALPASTWTMYYRAWQDSASTATLTRSPSTCSGNWENPQNAYSNDASYANSPTKDQTETYGGYGYSIPAGAQITQVRVRLDAFCADNDYLQLRVSADGGSGWLSTTSVYLSTTEGTHWVDVTSWTSWTPANLNGGSLQTQVVHKKSGGADSVSLDWIPVEVTYSIGAATGHISADLKVITSDGSTRATLATNVASSSSLTTSPATLSATYSFEGYAVVNQTDFLEVDYFVDVSVASTVNAHLRIDDQALAESDQTRITGISSSSSYNLNLQNSFRIDLESYPLDDADGLELLLRYNASSISERWLIKAYNWVSQRFSDVGFNSTIGTQPQTAGSWYTYALSISGDWANYVDADGTVLLQLHDGSIGATQTSIGVDFLGVRIMVGATSIGLRNASPISVHIMALWITNQNDHVRYDVNVFLNAGESTTYVFGEDITVPAGDYMVKAVTERGNIAVNSTNWQS
ncbi:MAG: hypothetical protein NWF05_10725 [Candidatus Bathyarchaeota archaeon]|nr:hypothetical protein [Candidatus Bathyarchaeota archaeon]